MPWLVGIDEAGYGPNLGPLVMTSVACRVPTELPRGDLWQVLREAVRRPAEAYDGRLLVADSKLVYSPARGLADLERSVLGTMSPARGDWPGVYWTIVEYMERVCPAAQTEVVAEPWFAGTTSLPVATAVADFQEAGARFAHVSDRAGVAWGLVRSVVVCPARFNGLIDRWGTKGAVLGLGLAELLRCNLNPDDGAEPLSFVIDKHGGRNHYSAMIQHALEDGMVLARQEGAARSDYEVIGLRRQVRVTFEPRADAGHFCVALASMCSKYLREVLMLEFNRFWQNQVPGLKATAGYPGDAERFFTAIRPLATRLGIVDDVLWRRK